MKITFLSRPGCHLCEEALNALNDHLARRGTELPAIEVEEVDIESDDELHRRFLERIPVIRIGGQTVSEFDFDPEEFDAAIARHPRGSG